MHYCDKWNGLVHKSVQQSEKLISSQLYKTYLFVSKLEENAEDNQIKEWMARIFEFLPCSPNFILQRRKYSKTNLLRAAYNRLLSLHCQQRKKKQSSLTGVAKQGILFYVSSNTVIRQERNFFILPFYINCHESRQVWYMNCKCCLQKQNSFLEQLFYT